MKGKFIGIILLVCLGLTGCRIIVTPGNVSVDGNVRFGIIVSPIIQVFEPTRGSGASYFVGDSISFRILTDRSGYVTLTAIDPDGSVYVLVQNFYVQGGFTTTISGPNDRSIFTLQPPRGLHRVRAAFTPSPTGTARITYQSVRGDDNWTRIIVTDVSPYQVRDIVETRFFIN
jgi:Domain of unknown function (DUF4384)